MTASDDVGCGDCGTPVDDRAARWCGRCGAALDAASPATVGAPEVASAASRSAGGAAGRWAPIVAAVAAVAVAGVLGDTGRQAPGGSVEDDRVAAPQPDDEADPQDSDVALQEPRCAHGNDGCVRWLVELDEADEPAHPSFGGTMLIDDVVITAVEGGVIVRGLEDGIERWRAEVPGAPSRELAVLPFDDRVLHLDGAGRLVARTLEDGEVAWASDPLPVEAARVAGLAPDGDGLLIAVRLDAASAGLPGRGAVLALDGSTGSWRWHQHGTGVALPQTTPPGPPGSAAAADDGATADGPSVTPEVVAVVQRDGVLLGLDRDGGVVWEVDQSPADLALLGPVVHVIEPRSDGPQPQTRLRDTGELLAEDGARVFTWNDEAGLALVSSAAGLQLIDGEGVRWDVELESPDLCGVELDADRVRLVGCDGEDRVLTPDGDELDAAEGPERDAAVPGLRRFPPIEARTEDDETTILFRGDDGTATDVAHLPGSARLLGPFVADGGVPETVLARGPDYLVALRVPATP